MDQRGLNNQPSDYLTAREAADRLGIKLETLYAYASRGLVSSIPGGSGRARKYLRDDIERLRARHDARSGHGPVAAGALRWGEPVLESALTKIDERGPIYRGRSAIELVQQNLSFEQVAEFLWTGNLESSANPFRATHLGVSPSRLSKWIPEHTASLTTLMVVLSTLAAHDTMSIVTDSTAVISKARTLIARLTAAVSLSWDFTCVEQALKAPSIAASLAVACGIPPRRDTVRAIEMALILCADHELNASTFAARVAASAGADLYGCLCAAMATLSGPRHGGACERVEALARETVSPSRAVAVIRDRSRRGDAIPGFGHPLYPQGDPRAVAMLHRAMELAPRNTTVRTLMALCEAMRKNEQGLPTIDVGLVALSAALGFPAGSALSLFAIGRTAGWIAHIMEQYAAGYLLRPRARYVGA
jgi:citrate synthase